METTQPDDKKPEEEYKDFDQIAISYEGLSPEEKGQLFANAFAEKIEEIIPPPNVWVSMSHKEKKKWLRDQRRGFLLPLALGKAFAKGILIPKPDELPSDILEKIEETFDKRVAYRDKPSIVYEIIRDLIEAQYIGFVNLKIEESREGELYAYFPPDNILIEPKEITNLLILYGISDSPEMHIVISTVLKEIGAQAEEIGIYDINPPDLLPLNNGKVLDMNDLKVKYVEGKYFTKTHVFYPSESFLKAIEEERIDESYFENEGWYRIIRQEYDDENWERLKLCLGTILAGKNTDEKINIIKGDPRTRKTTLLFKLIKPALGSFSVSGSLKLITGKDNRFSLQHALGAKVMLTSEAGDVIVRDIEMLKRITGGDTVYVDVKHKSPRQQDMYLCMFIATNEMPRFPRLTDEALLNRINIVETINPHNWTEEEKKLMDEVNIASFLEFVIYCTYLVKKRG
ncbi:DUF5906 domain-containing protein [Candidatus Methanodesulfokora washburnensis]|jgi:hypothetical protein|uniref:SF3 helicase domain-containing protein n=1 Tax=Candidatus Methanodesulfokora washburnensis TaxID=2478471 RepID=A0A3R9X0P9_9CREN|nr:DUF5906 domain-containing protein [Candidatus Methanodesulfokores washburnensis]RSN72431.1 hypothetical protein D6D85_13855 [Candidatus Methanodesulfokores washburnensis]